MRIFRSIIVLSTLLLAGHAQSNDVVDAGHTRVHLDSHASREVDNDSMRATLFTEVEDSDATRASSRVNRNVNEALRLLKREKLRVRTGRFQTYPTSEKGKIVRWRARSELIIEGEEFERVSAAIGQISGSMQLSRVEFFVTQARRDDAETELADQAIKTFLKKAEQITESFGGSGFHVADVVVSSNGSVTPPRPMLRAMSANADSMAPEFESGTSRVTVSVSGSILIPR